MSVQAMSWVLEESETRGEERLVLLSIANHASNDDGQAWPSIGQIAREANVHPDTAKRLVRKLHRDGHVTRDVQGSPDERVPHYKRSNLYVIHLDRDLIAKLREDRQDRGDDATPRDDTSPRVSASPGGQNVPGGGGQNVPGNGGSERPPKSSVEPSLNRQRAATPPKDAFEESFAEWYAAFPRKRERQGAKKAYVARRRGGASHEDLLTAAQRYAASQRGQEPKYIKLPASFLNNGWDDWLPGGSAEAERRTSAPAASYVQSNGKPINIDAGLAAQARGRSVVGQ